jgi:hypothetical protein
MELNSHTRGQVNEVEAFIKAKRGSVTTKAQIVAEIEQAGIYGLTPDEYVEMHGGLINTIRRRFTDLWKEGKVKKNDMSRKNAAGNFCSAWVLGKDEGIDNVPVLTFDQRVLEAYKVGYAHGRASRITENLLEGACQA